MIIWLIIWWSTNSLKHFFAYIHFKFRFYLKFVSNVDFKIPTQISVYQFSSFWFDLLSRYWALKIFRFKICWLEGLFFSRPSSKMFFQIYRRREFFMRFQVFLTCVCSGLFGFVPVFIIHFYAIYQFFFLDRMSLKKKFFKTTARQNWKLLDESNFWFFFKNSFQFFLRRYLSFCRLTCQAMYLLYCK